MSKSKDENKRQRILKAASTVFASQGFMQAKINEIAAIAQVADGTIYLYYKNKDDLLKAVFEYVLGEMIQELKITLQSTKNTIQDQLLTFIQVHLRRLLADRVFSYAFHLALQKNPSLLKEDRNPKLKEYLRVLESILESGQEQGIFRKDINPWLMKNLFFGSLSVLALNATTESATGTTPATREMALQVCDLFLSALRKPMSVKSEKMIEGPATLSAA